MGDTGHTGKGRSQKSQKMGDVIYGQTQKVKLIYFYCSILTFAEDPVSSKSQASGVPDLVSETSKAQNPGSCLRQILYFWSPVRAPLPLLYPKEVICPPRPVWYCKQSVGARLGFVHSIIETLIFHFLETKKKCDLQHNYKKSGQVWRNFFLHVEEVPVAMVNVIALLTLPVSTYTVKIKI